MSRSITHLAGNRKEKEENFLIFKFTSLKYSLEKIPAVYVRGDIEPRLLNDLSDSAIVVVFRFVDLAFWKAPS